MAFDGYRVRKGSRGRGFLFIGNHPCLDFVNTELMDLGRRVDRLGDFDDLVAWLVASRALSPMDGHRLTGRWGGTRAAALALGDARRLRADVRGLAERIAGGGDVPASTLHRLNVILAGRGSRAELVRAGRGFERRLRLAAERPGDALPLLAEMAADLLCRAELTRIRRCANARCVLFFYDVTRNGRRRWCSPRLCGNRMKVAAHYARRRAARTRRPADRRHIEAPIRK